MQLKIINTNIELANLVGILQALDLFSFDTETSGLDWTKDHVFLMTFSDGNVSWAVPVKKFEKETLALFLRQVLGDPKKAVVGHNLKFDAHMIMADFGVPIEREWHDTLLKAYLLDENRSNALKELMKPVLGLEPEDQTKIHAWLKTNLGKKDNWDFSKVPDELMLPYAGMDTFATFKLNEALSPQVDLHFKELYDTDRQVLKILWKLERNGVLVDRQKLEMFRVAQTAECDEHLQRFFQEAGRQIDPNSAEELEKFFYQELKLPVKFVTKKNKKPSTDDDALSAMDHPAAEALQLYRKATNSLTYAKGLMAKQDSNGVVHGDYSITTTKTGRFSCSDPNLQNVPKNKDLRRCFVVDPGLDMFLFDHAQIEMVGFAHYSKDPKMMAALNEGRDLHQLAASEVYEIPIDEVTKDQRSVGKGTNFSIIYGVGKKKLATYINGYTDRKLSDEEASAFKQKYFWRFPSVPRFQQEAMIAVRRKREPWGHFIKNQFGRVRRIQDPENKAYTAVNHLIQGWAPDLMKRGVVKIEKIFQPKWRQNVHDELRIDQSADLSQKQRQEVVHEIVKHLTDFPEVRVPVKCKVEWSRTNWAEVKGYKEE